MLSLKIDRQIELRVLQMRDAEFLFELIDENRDHLKEWLPWVYGSQSVEDTEEFIRRSLTRFSKNSSFVSGIWYDRELVGCIDLHEIDWFNRETSIGYWISATAQGQGIMTRSCQGLVDYAFGNLKLDRLEIHAAVTNHKSRAIPERLGFRREAIRRRALRVSHGWVDLVIYRLLLQEWQRNMARSVSG
jgi:ribosomal-protein-serine acetyltransferase